MIKLTMVMLTEVVGICGVARVLLGDMLANLHTLRIASTDHCQAIKPTFQCKQSPPDVPPPRDRRTPRKLGPREGHVQEIARPHRAAGHSRQQDNRTSTRRRWQSEWAREAPIG